MEDLKKLSVEFISIINKTISCQEKYYNNFANGAKDYNIIKSHYSAIQIGEKTALSQEEIENFSKDIRILLSCVDNAGDEVWEDKKTKIAALRFLGWAFILLKKIPDITNIITEDTPNDSQLFKSYKQIRAVELVIRSLINEKLKGKNNVTEYLKNTLIKKKDEIEKLKKQSHGDDLLTGLEFSRLVRLFLLDDLFIEHFDFIFNKYGSLNFRKTKKETLSVFLDDIRRIRNIIAHHKPLAKIQIDLLGLYFEELINPVQSAHDDGEVKTNPDSYMMVDRSKIDDYVNGLHEDLIDIRDSISNVASEVGEIKKDVGWIRRNNKTITIIGGFLVVIAISSLLILNNTSNLTVDVKEDTADIREKVTDVGSKISNIKQEKSEDPRKELVNLGYKWDIDSFNNAVLVGDLKAVGLYIDGGWDVNMNSTDPLSSIAYLVARNMDNPEKVIKYLFSKKSISLDDKFKRSGAYSIPQYFNLLELAIYEGNQKLLSFLINDGYFQLNKPSSDGIYPIIFAVNEETVGNAAIKQMIDLGADPSVLDYKAYRDVYKIIAECDSTSKSFYPGTIKKSWSCNRYENGIIEIIAPPKKIRGKIDSEFNGKISSSHSKCASILQNNLPFNDDIYNKLRGVNVTRTATNQKEYFKQLLTIELLMGTSISKETYDDAMNKACNLFSESPKE